MAKKKHWLHKEYDLEGYLHQHFHFKDNWEFLIFLVWGTFVALFFWSLTI